MVTVLQKNLWYDLTFLFPHSEDTGKDTADKPIRIQAHKMILASSSPVFGRMIFGFSVPTDIIQITDITPNAFRLLITYIYTNTIDVNNVEIDCLIDCLVASKKFMFPKLSRHLEEELSNRLTKQNFLAVYEAVESLDLETDVLKNMITIFVQKFIGDMIQDTKFTSIKRSTLKFILQHDKLKANELQLFDACLGWAKAECGRNCIDPNRTHLREVLGDLLYLIRLNSLSSKEFLNQLYRTEFFSDKETLDIVRFLDADDHPINGIVASFCHGKRSSDLLLKPISIQISMIVSPLNMQPKNGGCSTITITPETPLCFLAIGLDFSAKCEWSKFYIKLPRKTHIINNAHISKSPERSLTFDFQSAALLKGNKETSFLLESNCSCKNDWFKKGLLIPFENGSKITMISLDFLGCQCIEKVNFHFFKNS